MKHSLLVVSFLLLGQCCIAQEQGKLLLSDFDFSKGGYFLLGHVGIKNNDSLLGSYGDFYIDDITTLNTIKEKWKLSKTKTNTFTCEQFYYVDICKKGLSEKELTINNDCEKIVEQPVDKNDIDFYYYNYQAYEYAFNESELTAFKNSFKKAFKEEKKFASLELARKYRESVLNDSNLIMVLDPEWIKFDGTFVITYNHNLKWKNYEQAINNALTNLSKEIKRNYPGEQFFLDGQGIGGKNMVVEIYCNKELAGKFNLYPIECCKWEQFEPILVSYWKIKQ